MGAWRSSMGRSQWGGHGTTENGRGSSGQDAAAAGGRTGYGAA